VFFSLSVFADPFFFFDLKEKVRAVVVEDRIVAAFLCPFINTGLYVVRFLVQNIETAVYVMQFKGWALDQVLQEFIRGQF